MKVPGSLLLACTLILVALANPEAPQATHASDAHSTPLVHHDSAHDSNANHNANIPDANAHHDANVHANTHHDANVHDANAHHDANVHHDANAHDANAVHQPEDPHLPDLHTPPPPSEPGVHVEYDEEHYDIDHHHDAQDMEDYGTEHGTEAHDGLHLGFYTTLEVDPGSEECLFEDVPAEQLFRLEYQVIRGGELDINFVLKGPDHVEIYNGEHKFSHADDHQNEAEGHVSHHVKVAGTYSFCFVNTRSSDAKTISYFVHDIEHSSTQIPALSKSVEDIAAKLQDHLNPVVASMVRLTDRLDSIERMQHHLRTREAIHRDTAESTNSRVMWMSLLESLVLCVLVTFQLLYIRNWFSDANTRRRIV